VTSSRTQLATLAASLLGPTVLVLLLGQLLGGVYTGAALGTGSTYDDARIAHVREVAESWAVYFGTVLD
jgi:hypothetical protein